MRAQGAILLGKTTTPEFGTKCLTDSPLFGRTRNAWSDARSSGGSSGGAAVAVASGIAPLAIATDGGGSTRIPAACNGVVGLKQSNGVIPHSQVQDAFGNQTYVTPMTRTVADTALMMQAMAGEDASDPWSIGVPAVEFRRGVGCHTAICAARKILFCLAPPGRPVCGRCRRCLQGAASPGWKPLVPRSRKCPATDLTWSRSGAPSITPRGAHGSRSLRPSMAMMLSETFLKQLALATKVSGVDYQRAMFDRTALFRRIQSLLQRVDMLAMPTITRTALPIDQDLFGTIEIDGQVLSDVRPHWFPWTMPFNMTGHPAVSLPCGFGADGLPIGIQLVGQFRGDIELLRVCALFEASQDLLGRWPSLAG